MHRNSILFLVVLVWISPATSFAQQTSAPAANSLAPASQLEAARKAFISGNTEQALKQLDALAASNPEFAGTERLRGFIFYQQKNMANAEAAFAKAVAQDPADSEAMQMQGVALYGLGKPADAIPLLEKAHAAVPSTNVDPNYVLGVCYISVGRYDEARRAFAAQYGFPPDSAPSYLLAAQLLLRQGKLGIASDFARQAVALKPNLPLANLLVGEIALAQSQLPEAIAALNRERELNPSDGIVYERLGDGYLRSGDNVKAQEALGRAVLLEPTASGPYVQLGRVMLDEQNSLLATLYLERAVGMDPGSYAAHSLLAQAYQRTGRIADADKELQAATQLRGGKGAIPPKLEGVH